MTETSGGPVSVINFFLSDLIHYLENIEYGSRNMDSEYWCLQSIQNEELAKFESEKWRW